MEQEQSSGLYVKERCIKRLSEVLKEREIFLIL